VSIAVWMRREDGSSRVRGPRNVAFIVIPTVRIKQPSSCRARQAFQYQNWPHLPARDVGENAGLVRPLAAGLNDAFAPCALRPRTRDASFRKERF
jgi:hypothetical protein